MGTRLPFSPRLAEGEILFLTREPIGPEELVGLVSGRKHGAVVTFSGCVRDTEEDAPILSITYEAYEKMAEKLIRRIVEEAERERGVKVALKHRVGKVRVGETSVAVACAGSHRKEAFLACQFVIDRIKTSVPIWKASFEKA